MDAPTGNRRTNPSRSHGACVVSGGRASWFYFGGPQSERKRTAINVVELTLADGRLLPDDPAKPTHTDLKPKREAEH